MRRAVITGIGVISPGGIGREAFWETLVTGTSACTIAPIENLDRFRSHTVGAVCNWRPSTLGLHYDDVDHFDRHIQFAFVAAAEAWRDSGLDHTSVNSERLGVAAGTAIGSTVKLEQEYLAVSLNATQFLVDPAYASTYLYHALTPSTLSAELGARYHARGPVITVSTGCTSGVDAIAQAFEWLLFGDADIVLAGAAEAGLCPINMASFDTIQATTPSNKEPQTASRPFDRSRNGFVLGEGSAFLVLETWEHAVARGAHIYAEIRGYGSALNAYHMTGLERDGLDMAQAINEALVMARCSPEEVQYINAHGSSTLQNDIHETNAFKAVWGEQAYRIPISSIKSIIGHSLGAIGALEIAACALVIERGMIPPTINYRLPDPDCDLDYTPNTARCWPVDVLVSTASGFGGFQSALVLSKIKEITHA